jgi:protein ImuB
MDRLACVDLPAFPLQLLFEEHPDWKDHPAAVVAEDKPQAPLLWVNEKARRLRVLPGQKYAAALALATELRAGTVSVAKIEDRVGFITNLLRRFSPEVEPAHREPGVFWMNARGLGRLYPSLEKWSDALQAALRNARFQSTIVVGFTRFGTYALAKSSRVRKIFHSPREETRAADRVPLERLNIEPSLRDTLVKLGIYTVGEILQLPAEGLLKRFGIEAHQLHRLASGEVWTPLQPEAPAEPRKRQAQLEAPESNTERLLFLIKPLLDSLLKEMSSKAEALTELTLSLHLEDIGERKERIRPAAPTTDSAQILGLVRLRMESLELARGITELTLTAGGTKVAREQISLFEEKPRRDLEAGSRAFARLRAELGDQVVVRARLQDGHLPRSRFQWECLEKLTRPTPAKSVKERPLVRRIYKNPIPLPPQSRREPDGWLLRGVDHGPVQRMVGPYIVSGGWWGERAGIHRDYYFVKMKQGEVHWAFYDRRRRRWYLEGRVE